MKKKWILIIIFILLIIVVSFFIIKKAIWNYKVAHATKVVELSTNQLTVYQNNIKLSNIIKKINGKLTTNPKIDTTKIGRQEIIFNYTTDEGYPVQHKVEIEIVDVTPPLIFASKSKTIYTNFDGNLSKELFCGDNYDPNPKCYIEGEYDTKTKGEYNLKFVGIDSSNNKSENNFKLIVKEPVKNNTQEKENYRLFKTIKKEYAGENRKFGIDISHWQGDIDFDKVKDAGVEFVYIRVGRGNGVGKEYVEDTKFKQNIEGFNKVGIPVGIYFYSNANGKKDAKKEVKWIIDKIRKYKVDLEIVFDWENWDYFQEYNLSFYSLKEMAKEFNNEVKKEGYVGMLYSSKSYLENIWGEVNYPVWLAHYTNQTNYQGKYIVWQLCENGKVDGIEGKVDINIRYQ